MTIGVLQYLSIDLALYGGIGLGNAGYGDIGAGCVLV